MTKRKLPSDIVEYFRREGAKGGKKGGQKGGTNRMAQLTSEERTALAQKAALARWKKAPAESATVRSPRVNATRGKKAK